MMTNPLLGDWTQAHGAPPFDMIKDAHFGPAFDQAIAEKEAEIAAIAGQRGKATFANTIEALEQCGPLLRRVYGVFGCYQLSLSTPDIQAIARKVVPQLSRLEDGLYLNDAIWGRVDALYKQRDQLGLSPEEMTVLERYHTDFVRAGAALDPQQRAELSDINAELSTLQNSFSENLLADMNNFELVLDDESALAGLPEETQAAARQAAVAKGLDDKWIISLNRSSWTPFLTFADRRDLRQKVYDAYVNQGRNGNDHDNRKIVSEIAAQRARRAKLLGYPTHAHWVLDDRMAQTPEVVGEFLGDMWTRAQAAAEVDRTAMQDIADSEGGDFKLAAWDWWYYAEKLRQRECNFDNAEVAPYFELTRVRDGAFAVATRLWGLTFHARKNLPVYASGVEAFEVKEADGQHIGLLYLDWPARPGKRQGAWMAAPREQEILGGDVTPIITNTFNFADPTGPKPVLLSPDEVRTVFHEFGHGLHGLLSKVKFPRLSGTSVLSDFVEFPSQIMENWAFHPEVLANYARHIDTDEPIPVALCEKINKALIFNQGFRSTEFLAAAQMDMDWHLLETDTPQDTDEFEKDSLRRMGLMDEIAPRYRSTYFAHIFSGSSYSAGYYVYEWAAVLDADGFGAFEEKDLFDPALAKSLRDNVLSRGGTEHPMKLYTAFRGREPTPDALLKSRGFMDAAE